MNENYHRNNILNVTQPFQKAVKKFYSSVKDFQKMGILGFKLTIILRPASLVKPLLKYKII